MGINLVPCERDGRLVIEAVEPGGRVSRLSNLAVGDEIIAINEISITSRSKIDYGFSVSKSQFHKTIDCYIFSSFEQAQETFKKALNTPELRLKVIKIGTFRNEEMEVDGNNNDDDNKENRAYLENQQTSSTSSRLGRLSTSITAQFIKAFHNIPLS